RWFDDLCGALCTRGRLGRLALALALSILAWGCKLGMFACLLVSVGLTGVPLWKVFFASAVTDLTMALPVHGLFSMGTVETGWVAGFAVVGVEGVVEEGFAVHVLWLLLALLIMCSCLPWLALARPGRKDRTDL
ncbi:hypothetical protein JW921_06245, partial [Candidatus Fermentibacterales bacterium]|nr:hypothetical protein [Candidatus Fermentibacterales bacterium]